MNQSNTYKFLEKKSLIFKVFISAFTFISLFVFLTVFQNKVEGALGYFERGAEYSGAQIILIILLFLNFILDLLEKNKQGVVVDEKYIRIYTKYKKIKLKIQEVSSVEYVKRGEKNIFYRFKAKSGSYDVTLNKKFKLLNEIEDLHVPTVEVKKMTLALKYWLIAYVITSVLTYIFYGVQQLMLVNLLMIAVALMLQFIGVFKLNVSIKRPERLMLSLMALTLLYAGVQAMPNSPDEHLISQVYTSYEYFWDQAGHEASDDICRSLVQGDSAGKWAVCSAFYGRVPSVDYKSLKTAASYNSYAGSISEDRRLKKNIKSDKNFYNRVLGLERKLASKLQ